MKRYVKSYFLFILVIYSNCSHSEIIDISYDLVAPFESTSLTDFTIDFGAQGSRIDLTSITFHATFSGNLWSPGETYGIGWQTNPLHHTDAQGRLVRNDTSSSVRVFDFPPYTNEVLISEEGLALFRLGVFGGNGAYFENLTITANGTISPVPIPSGIILFTSGLALLTHITRRSTRSAQTTRLLVS